MENLPPVEFTRQGYSVSTDKSLLNTGMIYEFLSKRSYWSEGIPRVIVQKSIEGSLCFGLYNGPDQIGYARVVSDLATFAFLADVFVLENYRGDGLGKWLLACIFNHPNLQNLRRWMLVTRDAHGLYEKYGFKPLAKPDQLMEIHNPNIYF